MVEESRLIISIDARNAERNARELNRELNNMTTNGIRAESQMNSMGSAFRSLAGYMAGVVTIGTAISKMDTYTGLQNRLKLVTDSQNELNQAMSDTFAIAQKTASSWDSAAMVYQRFADNADRLNITMKQTASLTETVSKAISVSGGTAASADAALVQFGQALASGVLRGEEFNSIAEQAPGLLKAIANGLDTNVGSLRAMAAEGKITADVLVKSLTKAQPYIDDLFNKTDFTISQSFTKLSNEVTKFVGEAGKANGAASGLSDAINVLANNLSTIANIAVIGGVALLTKTILSQTVAIYGSVTASIARRGAILSELAAQAAASTVETTKAAAIAEHAAMQVIDAKATAARMTGIQRLAYIQSTVIPLEAKATQLTAAHTATTAADTVVQNANNAARSRGAMLLGAVGGPIGAITIGVAALAAGYMYMSSRAAEATAKLEEQGKIADQTDEELKKLSGNDKISSIEKLTETFESQNATLAKSKESVDAVLFAIRASSVENEKARKITEDARNGVISYNEAIQLLNKEKISTDLYDKLKEQANQYDENSLKAGNSQRVLKILGVEFKLAGNAAQNAANQIDKNSDSMGKNETAAQKAARAQKEYTESLFDKDFEANFTKYTLAAGLSEGKTNALLEAANYARKKGVEFTKEMAQEALRVYEIENKNKEVIDARNEAEKKNTKEKEKQQKILQASAKVQANAAKYNFSGLESKYSLPSGMLAALHAIETGNTGKSNQVNKKSGAAGGFQFMPDTAKRFNVNPMDLQQSAEGAAKYMSYLLELFKGDLEKAVRAYHAGEGNVQRGTGMGKYNNDYWEKFKGYSAGSGGYKSGDVSSKDFEKMLDEAMKMVQEQANARKSLELEVANEVTKIRENLKDKLVELDKAGFSPERKKELEDEYKARAENEIAIAEYALKTKLEDYKSFGKSESELLKASFDEKKFYAARDIELSKEQRVQAVELLDKQYKQESAYLELGRQQRIFQYKQGLMTETAAMQERYRLEMLELMKIVNIDERRIAMQAKASTFIRGSLAPVGTPLPVDQNGMTNEQKLQEETGRELLAMQARYQAAQVAAQDNADELLRIDQVYLKAKEDLHAQHDFKVVEARKADHDAQLQLYSQMLSQASTVWGSMTQMVKDAKGENSKTFKAMFLAQQTMAIAQQIINTELAAGATTAQTGIFGIPAASAIRAMGYASVALIAGQTIAGFKDGGYTGNYGTSQVAGVVHGKEFVVNAEGTRRNRAALEAMNSGATLSGGGGMVQPIINVYTLEGETADVTTNADGSLDIRIRKVAGDYLRNELSSQNSQTSKAIKNNFNVTPKR
ncbi:MAG: tape measure protein [Acinetobacter sp.]